MGDIPSMNNLALIRENRGLSQRDLADMLGVSQPTIQRAESEAPSAKLDTYKKCAVLLKVELWEIFSTRDEVEDKVISLYRNVDSRSREQMVRILLAAQNSGSESDR